MNAISTKVEINDPYLNMGWADREFKETLEDIWAMDDDKLKVLLQDIIQDQVHGTPVIRATVKSFSKKSFACDVARFEVAYQSKEWARDDRAPIAQTCIVSFM